MKTIMIVDDDIFIGNMLEETLTQEGYQTVRAYSGTEALLLMDNCSPDLVLLDLMLPGLSGEEVLKRLSGIPVIVVSAKVDVDDKIRLLISGASDYLTKPFEIGELLARITVQLRREHQVPGGSRLRFGGIVMDTDSHAVLVGEEEVHLTKTEYAILRQLMQNASQVVTKSQLLDLISMDTPDCMESSLKVHVSNLRRKLRETNGREYIEAVWGIGFKMNES